MRNLLKYPITKEEVLNALEYSIKAYLAEYETTGIPCGDIHPTALQEAIDFLTENYPNEGRGAPYNITPDHSKE